MPTEKNGGSAERIPIPEALPLLPSGDAVIYPYMLFPFVAASPEWVRAVDAAVATENKMVGLFTLKNPEQPPAPENLHLEDSAETGGVIYLMGMDSGDILWFDPSNGTWSSSRFFGSAGRFGLTETGGVLYIFGNIRQKAC